MASNRPNKDPGSLEGQLLIAMPTIGDPRFDRSVILMCSHSSDGAMGIVINKLVGHMNFGDLLEQLEIDADAAEPGQPVHFGGPVDMGRGFVLHTNDYNATDQTIRVTSSIRLTATVDILKAMAAGQGPRRALLALGYAGWAAGQLEHEIQANAWLHCDADELVVFDTDVDRKWSRALARLGAEVSNLSLDAGHA